MSREFLVFVPSSGKTNTGSRNPSGDGFARGLRKLWEILKREQERRDRACYLFYHLIKAQYAGMSTDHQDTKAEVLSITASLFAPIARISSRDDLSPVVLARGLKNVKHEYKMHENERKLNSCVCL